MWKVSSFLLLCLIFVSTTVFAAEPGGERPTSVPSSDTDRSLRESAIASASRDLARVSHVDLSRSPFTRRQGGSQGSQQRGWVSRHPVWFGALVGVGPGAVVGFSSGNLTDSGVPASTVFGAGLGAGIGSLVGFVVGLAR
jgi:hypothetical protein